MNSTHAQLLKAPIRNWRWLILLFLLPMLACGMLESAPTTSPSPNFHPTGQIVFECWPERTTSRLCLVNADGTGYRQLTDKTTDQRPAWSPDGKRIAFVRQMNDAKFTTALFVMNLDGSGLIQLTDLSIVAQYPSWSPDAGRIIFNYSKDEYRVLGIAVVNVDGTGLKLLTASGEVAPKWSPDGKGITFVKGLAADATENASHIYIMDTDSSNKIELITIFSGLPSWSPDGKKIVFMSGKAGQRGIWIINTDGSGLTRLSDSGAGPSWSPDGQYIVFYKSDPACGLCPTSGQLWIMRADGSQPTKITDGPVDQNPNWGPMP